MGVPLAAAGAGLNIFGAIQQGEDEKRAANFNADQAEREAIQTLTTAKEDERRLRAITRKEIGSMRANVGASGVTMDGSILDILQESAANAELDALSIKNQGEMKSTALRNDARMQRYYGETAGSRALLGALGGAVGGASQYYAMRRG